MDELIYKVYALPDELDRITAVACEVDLTDLTGWVQIDEGAGDQYLLAQTYYFPDGLTDEYGRYLYRVEDGAAVARTQAELDAEGIPAPKASSNGIGLPTGGESGQTLEKLTATDYHAGWAWPKATYPPSLIPNWDMLRTPVNQRAIVSGATVSTAGYFLDCMKLLSGSVVWTENTGLAFGAGAKIVGYIEENYRNLLGKDAVFGIQTPGDLIPAELLGAFPSAVAGATVENVYTDGTLWTVAFGFEYRSGGVVLRGATQNYVPYVSVQAASAVTVERMKPELGKISTLLQAPPPDYGAVLARCERYYRNLGNATWYRAVSFSTTLVQATVDLAPAMRTPPTCTLEGTGSASAYMGDSGTTSSNYTATISPQADCRHLLVNCTFDAATVTSSRCGMLKIARNLICNAEL